MPLSSIAMNLNFDMTARAETDGKLWVTGTYQHPTFRPMLEGIPANGAVSLAFGKDTPQDTGRGQLGRGVGPRGLLSGAGAVPVSGGELSPRLSPADRRLREDHAGGLHSSTELAIASFRALDKALDR